MLDFLFVFVFGSSEPVIIEYTGEARIFCTFGQNVQKMYKRIKEYFSGGDLCHAIVYGTPLVIRNQSISMENKSERNY